MTLITQAEFAKRHNCSRQYIHKLVKLGKLDIQDGLINTDQADETIALKRMNSVDTGMEKARDLQVKLLKSQLHNSLQKGHILEAKAKRESGVWVLKSEVAAKQHKQERIVRDLMFNIADRVSHQLANQSQDSQTIHTLIIDELYQALEGISQQHVQ